MELENGQRVRHSTRTDSNGNPARGIVHLFPDAEPGCEAGEVRWDNCFVAEGLSLVADDLIPE